MADAPPRKLDALHNHYSNVVKAILDGRLVPFLGAGVNLCERPPQIDWQAGQFLPSGSELSAYLADNFSYPERGESKSDLLRVSQYVAVMLGTGPLYEELRKLFDANYPTTCLHQFFASLPSLLRDKKYSPSYQLIVTTNYDDVLERAFQQAGEPFDVVVYVAEGEARGKFWHFPPKGRPVLVEKPNKYLGLSLEDRTVILKIHGAVNRADPERDSYVITEDHYIDYLTRTDISGLLPMTLTAKLKHSHFLFLGYSLRDWNLRVILHRIWGEQKLSYKSWAIQCEPSEIDQRFWVERGVEMIDARLEEYVPILEQYVNKLQSKEGLE